MIIYMAKFPNGKMYIGKTTQSFELRIKQHKQASKKDDTVFYRAIKKYKWDNVEWSIIENAETVEELDKRT